MIQVPGVQMTIINQLILIFLLVIINTSAQAYYTLNTNIGANFAGNLVHINVADHSCDNLGRTPTEILHLAQLAVDQFWNNVPTSRLTMMANELVTVDPAFKTEKVCSSLTASGSCVVNSALLVERNILIACNQNSELFPNGSILGMTVPNNIVANHIVGSLFLLNDIATTNLADKSDTEFIIILAHEIGHAIGLGHTSSPVDLMYYQLNPLQKQLGNDDIDGLTYLYGMNQPDILSCNSVNLETPAGALPSFLIGLLPLLFFIQRRFTPVKRRS